MVILIRGAGPHNTGLPSSADLLLTGMLGAAAGVPLFDRLFAPLVAAGAGAGAVTMVMLEQLDISAP